MLTAYKAAEGSSIVLLRTVTGGSTGKGEVTVNIKGTGAILLRGTGDTDGKGVSCIGCTGIKNPYIIGGSCGKAGRC